MTALALAPAAFLAGILMFLAPCTLPLVPAYLAFIAGVSEEELQDEARRRAARRKLITNALAFILGFSVLFIALGIFAGEIGSFIGIWRLSFSRIGGTLLILFGIAMLGIRLPGISGQWQAKLPAFLKLGSWQSSLFAGFLFALGWSPCIGPILGSILFLASSSATALAGGILLAIFSLGLAVPFLGIALLAERATAAVARLKTLSRALQTVGGIVLILLGALMLSGNMGLLVAWGFSAFEGYGGLLNHL